MFRWYSRYFGKNILYHQNEQKELVLVENIIDAHRYLLICFDPGRSGKNCFENKYTRLLLQSLI